MCYVCDVLYAVLYVHVSCFVVRGCAVSMRYINVSNCDMFSVINEYPDHLKLCVLMVEGMYSRTPSIRTLRIHIFTHPHFLRISTKSMSPELIFKYLNFYYLSTIIGV